MLVGVAAVAISCGSSTPSEAGETSAGGSETSGATETSTTGATETSTTAATDTPTSTTAETDTSGTCGDDETGVGTEVEETHVVLLEDCGLRLSCDPLDIDSIDECATGLWAAGQPGLLRVDYLLGDSDGGPSFQEAFLVMADRRVVRQARAHEVGTGGPCSDPPWVAWGPHEVCDVVNEFNPEGNVINCEEVPDFSCADLVELYQADPLPPVPCDTRSEEECNGPLDAEAVCQWSADGTAYPSDTCEPVGSVGRCLEHSTALPPDCELPPLCAGLDVDAVLYRDNGGDTIDVLPSNAGCWLPEGFDRCAWSKTGELVEGPAACACAC